MNNIAYKIRVNREAEQITSVSLSANIELINKLFYKISNHNFAIGLGLKLSGTSERASVVAKLLS